MLKGKKILLGVTGSIAAYKIATLIRLLIKSGAEVKVIMTDDACEFITPLTLSTLSKNEVVISFYRNEGGRWNNHVELGLWADLFIIAPATANTIAKMNHGICDHVLLAAYLSAKCPVVIAPAMDLDMWKHPSTQNNIKSLKGIGVSVIPVGNGELASGLSGEGRMAEPEEIHKYLKDYFHQGSLKGTKIIVTGGPTFESLDPVRFIGNHSSGKMGIALAEAAYQKGATVHLILGPTHLEVSNKKIKVTRIRTAAELFKETTKLFKGSDACIMAAAVADYTPVRTSKQKIKKKDGNLQLELGRTKDVLKHLGTIKKDGQYLVGFALESDKGEKAALRKLKSKNLDFIVLNSMTDKGAGFKHNTNKISIFDKHNNSKKFKLKTKQAVALDILDYLEKMMEL